MKCSFLLVPALALGCTSSLSQMPLAEAPVNAAEQASPSTPEATPRPKVEPSATTTPADGASSFTIYEGFLHPMQEPGEESEAPNLDKALTSSAPSTDRAKRASKGYGQLRFSRDLAKAYIEVRMDGVSSEDIVMFHIHCGPPGVLGPIIVDIGKVVNLQKDFADGREAMEIGNSDLTFVQHMPAGLKPRLPEGCPVDKGFLNQVKTIAGLEYLARQGVLYFNLHTKAHTFYGEMRGQIYAAPPEPSSTKANP